MAIYTSTQFKNCSKVIVCLRTEKYVETEVPIMPENPSDNDKRVREVQNKQLPEIGEGAEVQSMQSIYCGYVTV